MPPYIWMPPYVWMHPLCLDAPICFDAPISLDTTHMFGCPLHIWMPPVCLDAPICVATILNFHHLVFFFNFNYFIHFWKYSFGFWGNVAPSKQHPNIWWACKHIGVSKHTGGNPNIVGTQMYGGVQTYREAYGGHPKIQGAIQHDGHQTYRGHPNILEHPNVWGHMDTPLVWQSRHSLCCGCTGGIQTVFFLYNPELYLPFWISAILFFLMLNILSIVFCSFKFCTVCSETAGNIAKQPAAMCSIYCPI